MADDSEINIVVNDLNSIMNNILAIDENPDDPNVTWLAIHASITAAIQDMNEIGQQVDEDVAIMVQDIVDAMHLVAEEAEEAEQDGNTNNVRLRLQDVIDAVGELPRANENEGVGGYRKRKRKHRTHRKRKHRTQRKRNRKRTRRNRK